MLELSFSSRNDLSGRVATQAAPVGTAPVPGGPRKVRDRGATTCNRVVQGDGLVCVCVCECYVSIVFVRKHEVWPWEVLRVYRIYPRAVSVSIESSRSCSMHKLYQWLLVHLYDC